MLQDMLQIVISKRSVTPSLPIRLSSSCSSSGQPGLSPPEVQGINPAVPPHLHASYPELGDSQCYWEPGDLDVHQSSVLGKPVFLSLYVKYGWESVS
jgi:hypothetical protein